MTERQGGLTRREMMTGLGVGAGAVAGLAIAGAPLTAAAAPITNHIPAWGPVYHDLETPAANLSYLGIDGLSFYDSTGARYYEGGRSGPLTGYVVAAPVPLPVGSVVRRIDVAVSSGDPCDVYLAFNDWEAPVLNGPGAASDVHTVEGGSGMTLETIDLGANPVIIGHGGTYQVTIGNNGPAAPSVRGVTIGYTPPTAGFVPFSGSTPRVYDSREGDGKLGFQQERVINLGNAGVRGALFNLTVTGTEGAGFVAAFAGNVAYPGNSSINYFGGEQNLANGVVCAVAPNGSIRIRGGGPSGRTHVVIDRLGWFI
ncbi:MAG TPA: hypothetical protein VNQ73_22525 [Ilumatobacter sp.]|nr:hypothetical protein [Ilumatobacter sp.]